MSRIPTPVTIDAAPAASQPLPVRPHLSGAPCRQTRRIEIVQHVALNTWTNYINSVAQTEIDFPVVKAQRVA